MKARLTLAILLVLFCYTQGDTKLLREVNIYSDQAYRQETFLLKNDNSPAEELVIEGTHTQSIYPKDDKNVVYRIETTYVADKDGYRAKYKLTREPYTPIVLHLNPSSLKALAG